ncbi:hypothetical protein Trco_001467 [Trichoderma cornu-damae]|uniref:Uncharacterized protein n=1 Tax=Trichoderma cornu-damae TaxID=654480 RepID=A0A9P8QYY4_9HYPO|nr:hypothetical protein Trco_001467 [Trichoderma cornu-damae]
MLVATVESCCMPKTMKATSQNHQGPMDESLRVADARRHARRDARRAVRSGSGALDFLAQLAGGDDFLRGPLGGDSSVVQQDDVVGRGHAELHVVRDEDASAALHQGTVDAVGEYPLARVRIDSAQAVVEEDMSRVGIHGAGQGDSLLLAARERDALFANQRLVAVIQNFEIALKGAGDDDVLVSLFVVRRGENDVVLDVGVDEPGSLSDIGNGIGEAGLGVGANVLPAAAAGAEHPALYKSHLAEEAHEHGRLARTGGARDDVEPADPKVHVEVEQPERPGTVFGHAVLGAPDEGCVPEADAFLAVFVHIVQPELPILLRLLLQEVLFNSVDGDLSFLDVGEHVTEEIEGNAEKHEEGNGRERDGRVQGLLLNQRVHQEGEEGDEHGNRVPDGDGEGPQEEPGAQGLELGLALLVHNLAEPPLPGKVLDDADVLEDLVCHIDALVSSSHNVLGGEVEAASQHVVDGQEEDHDDDAGDGAEAHDLPQQEDGNGQLRGGRGAQEVNVGGGFGNLEAVDRHQVDDGSQIGLFVVSSLFLAGPGGAGGFGVIRAGSLVGGSAAGLVVAARIGLGLVAEQNLVLAGGGLPAQRLGVDVADDDGTDANADLAANPEGHAIAVRADSVNNREADDEEPENADGRIVGAFYELEDGLEQQGGGEGEEAGNGRQRALHEEQAAEVLEQVPGKGSGLLEQPVIGNDGSRLVLGQEVPDISNVEWLLPALPDDGVDPREGGNGKETRQGLARRLDAVLPLQHDGLVALSSGGSNAEQQRVEGKVGGDESLGKLAVRMDQGGAEDEDGQDPFAAVKGGGVIPDRGKNQGVYPSGEPGNGGEVAAGSKSTGYESKGIDRNQSGKGKLLDELRQALRGGSIGLDYRALGRHLRQGQAAAVDLEVVVIAVLGFLVRRDARMVGRVVVVVGGGGDGAITLALATADGAANVDPSEAQEGDGDYY